jgi:hypothetical protein
MNGFLTKIAMLVMFLLAVSCGWAAWTMVFPASLFNILLGILSAFFLLRGFELADKVNKLGPYAEEEPEHKPKPRNEPPEEGETES